MKSVSVKVPWKDGLHLRPAGLIVRSAGKFRATVRLRLGRSVSEATSVLGLIILCAALNTTLTIEAEGDDENEALAAIAAVFQPDESARTVE